MQVKQFTTVQVLALQNVYIKSSFIPFNISSSLLDIKKSHPIGS